MRKFQLVLASVAVVIGATVAIGAAGVQTKPAAPPAAAATAAPVDARIWIGHAAEMEEYLRTVAMQKFEALSVGVTKPMRAFLPEGGPVKYLVWKTIQPGRYFGYWESYKSEIAAYELDKLLTLNMVPPTVEKTFRGERGAAVLWISPAKSFKDMGVTSAPTAPDRLQGAWNRQLVKAKMFHNLINNIDPNLGNWLVDPAWNLVLIDFSRCFTQGSSLPHAFTRVDPDLWDRFKALTEESLTKTLGAYMGKSEVRAILQRRDKMGQMLEKLIKERGEAYVFMREG